MILNAALLLLFCTNLPLTTRSNPLPQAEILGATLLRGHGLSSVHRRVVNPAPRVLPHNLAHLGLTHKVANRVPPRRATLARSNSQDLGESHPQPVSHFLENYHDSSLQADETGTLKTVDYQDAIQNWNKMVEGFKDGIPSLSSLRDAVQLLKEVPVKLSATEQDDFYQSISQSVLEISNDFPWVLVHAKQYVRDDWMKVIIEFVTASKLPPVKEESIKSQLNEFFKLDRPSVTGASMGAVFNWFYPTKYLYAFKQAKGIALDSMLQKMKDDNTFPEARTIFYKMLSSSPDELHELLELKNYPDAQLTPEALSSFFLNEVRKSTYYRHLEPTIEKTVEIMEIAEKLFDDENKTIFYHNIADQVQSLAAIIPDGVEYFRWEEFPDSSFATVDRFLTLGKVPPEQVDRVRLAIRDYYVNRSLGGVYLDHNLKNSK